ncbi:MAG: bifunctional acetate--CoA ligase family protein/GNAT family N-acetyltransferase, partial [Ramlibacter sp.]
VLAADALPPASLATLSPATRAALDGCLPPTWSHGNPVDIVGDAPVARYVAALDVLLAAPEVDGVLFMHAPTAIVPAAEIAKACLPALQRASRPVLGCWLGGETVQGAAAVFERSGVATYDAPERAVAGWQQLVQYHAAQQALLELPEAGPAGREPQAARAAAVLQRALDAGHEWLSPGACAELLEAYGIPMVATCDVADAQAAARIAQGQPGPVALKIRSPQIVHKTDVGGVALGLRGADEVMAAATGMFEHVRARLPQAQIDGFTVQAMADPPGAWELICGIASDATFGPVVLFGEGGTAVELRADRALALPPLNDVLARELVGRTRISRMLAGFRGRPGVDARALRDVLVRISAIACEQPAVAELDINPLLADERGVLAVDARVRLRRAAPGEPSRLALRPYPRELAAQVECGGRTLVLRPIRPEDGARLAAFYAGASPADLRLRFFMVRREIPRSELARYCQIDYEREMTLVALDGEAMAGEVRAVCDPDNEVAEFALQVATAWQCRGLGTAMLRRMIGYLAGRGVRQLRGECLEANAGMRALASRLGFELRLKPLGLVEMTLALR